MGGPVPPLSHVRKGLGLYGVFASALSAHGLYSLGGAGMTDFYRYTSKLHEDPADVRNNPYFLLWKLAK